MSTEWASEVKTQRKGGGVGCRAVGSDEEDRRLARRGLFSCLVSVLRETDVFLEQYIFDGEVLPIAVAE